MKDNTNMIDNTPIDNEQHNNKVKKAIERCQLDLQKDPNNAKLHIRLGDLYLQWHLDIFNSCQYIDEAITEYQCALETYMDSAEIFYKIGKAQFYKGDLDKAINYLNMAIEKDNKFANAYLVLAETYTRKAYFFEAINSAKSAIKYKPFRNSSAHYLLHKLYQASSFKNFKKNTQSKFEYVLSLMTFLFDKKAISNVGKSLSYLRFFPTLLKGFYYVQIGNLEAAINLYSSAIEKAPGFVPLYCLLGDTYLAIGHFEDAITEYKMAIWLDSLNIPAYRHLCQAYEEQGDYDRAIEIYLKLISIMPTVPDFHSNLANLYYVKGDIPSAISQYQTAITLNPNKQWTSVIAQTLGFVYQENQNNLDAAICSYQNAYTMTPEDIDIYINLGSAFYDKEDYDNAVTVYRKALELDPENSKIHCNLGFLHWGKGNTEEAIKEYELAIKYDENYDIAYNNLGVIYLDDLGRVQKAIELFKKSAETNPNYALAHFNLARAITIVGDKIEAAKLYQIAQDINKVTNEIDPQDIVDKINGLFS